MFSLLSGYSKSGFFRKGWERDMVWKNRLRRRFVELQAVSSGGASALAADNSGKYDMIKEKPVWTLLRLIKVNNYWDLDCSALSAAGNPRPHVPNICLKSQVLHGLTELIAGNELSTQGKAFQGSARCGTRIAKTERLWIPQSFPGDKIRRGNYSQAK